jgi:hypothetical protein
MFRAMPLVHMVDNLLTDFVGAVPSEACQSQSCEDHVTLMISVIISGTLSTSRFNLTIKDIQIKVSAVS